MLILARRPGERVVIGDEILVTVMEVSASTVRLGIEAPRGVSIFREEIWLAVKEENRAAAEAQADSLPSAPVARPDEDAGQVSAPVVRPDEDAGQATAEPGPGPGEEPEVHPPSAPTGEPRGDAAASEQQPSPPRDPAS
jgi:carbon storage regulator